MLEEEFDPADWEAMDEPEPAAKAEANHGKADREGGGRAFRFVAAGDLKLSSPDFLIEDWIERDSFGVMFGQPGGGKTFLMLDMLLCVAAGIPFHGSEVKQGPVFYIAGEGHNGLTRRIHAWATRHGVSLDGLPFFVSVRAAQFLNEDHADDVMQAVRELARLIHRVRPEGLAGVA
ncbi:hypothetical protein AEB_P2501 [Altererythrobacter sp. B11]|uniref:AAA family ATPase n=1 Tax=Altererythrobacter sp. B11 TaxID=2060312 RepID=UPI000DC715B4|nr:AAA family ATPase [Altererythrobacter sp. B11]BBC73369.1 hypothetical protein AEB_P2501 [Altererythrobacter sp. B11]